MPSIGNYKIKTHPFFIAQVNPESSNEDYKKIAGYDFYFIASVDGESAILINPIECDKSEEYWKVQFEVLKGFISDDFEDFLEMMLSDGAGMTATVPLNELTNFRFMTEEDADEMDDSIEYLIEKYELDRETIEACW